MQLRFGGDAGLAVYDAARSDHAQLREADAALDAQRDRLLIRATRKRAQTGSYEHSSGLGENNI
jgi:hypothetical protein